MVSGGILDLGNQSMIFILTDMKDCGSRCKYMYLFLVSRSPFCQSQESLQWPLVLLCSFSDFSFPLAHTTPACWRPALLPCRHGTLLTQGLCSAQPSAQILMDSSPTPLRSLLGSPLLGGADGDLSVDTTCCPQPPCSPCPWPLTCSFSL